MAGNVEEVLIRLNLGEDVNQKCYPRYSVLTCQVRLWLCDWLRYSTPLHDAVCCGRQEVVKILLDRGANVNEVDYKSMTPLKLAIRWGNTSSLTVSSVWVSLSSGTARTTSRRCCWTREQWRLLRCPRRFLLLTLTLLGWGECPGGSPLPEDESQSVGYECLKYVLCLVENLYNYFTDINLKYCILVKPVSINKTGLFLFNKVPYHLPESESLSTINLILLVYFPFPNIQEFRIIHHTFDILHIPLNKDSSCLVTWCKEISLEIVISIFSAYTNKAKELRVESPNYWPSRCLERCFTASLMKSETTRYSHQYSDGRTARSKATRPTGYQMGCTSAFYVLGILNNHQCNNETSRLALSAAIWRFVGRDTVASKNKDFFFKQKNMKYKIKFFSGQDILLYRLEHWMLYRKYLVIDDCYLVFAVLIVRH